MNYCDDCSVKLHKVYAYWISSHTHHIEDDILGLLFHLDVSFSSGLNNFQHKTMKEKIRLN